MMQAGIYEKNRSYPPSCIESMILSIWLFFYRVPDARDVAFGELRQEELCLDTMGHLGGGTVHTYKCHGQAGNQVGRYTEF